ncbi:hypothetical protein U1Q18_030157 [Sarracenia purpurea var. burkii]
MRWFWLLIEESSSDQHNPGVGSELVQWESTVFGRSRSFRRVAEGEVKPQLQKLQAKNERGIYVLKEEEGVRIELVFWAIILCIVCVVNNTSNGGENSGRND